jgi:hypothetical protein
LTTWTRSVKLWLMQPGVALRDGLGCCGDAGTDELWRHTLDVAKAAAEHHQHPARPSRGGEARHSVTDGREQPNSGQLASGLSEKLRSGTRLPSYAVLGLNVTRSPPRPALSLIVLAIAYDLGTGCALLARHLRGRLRGLAIQVMLLRMDAPKVLPWAARHADAAAHDLKGDALHTPRSAEGMLLARAA